MLWCLCRYIDHPTGASVRKSSRRSVCLYVTSDCPGCYDWVQRQVRVVRQQLLTLSEIITYVMTRPPQQINDTDYLDQLMTVNDSVQQLWQDASVHGNICQHIV